MGVLVPDKSIMAKADPNEIKTIIVLCPVGKFLRCQLSLLKSALTSCPPSLWVRTCARPPRSGGMRVTCKLLVQNRKVTVEVVPSATAMLIKALKEPPRDRKKVKHISHDGDISWEDIYSVARTMRSRSNAKTFQGTVLEVLGTCRGLGCTIAGEDAEDCTAAIHDGEHEGMPEK